MCVEKGYDPVDFVRAVFGASPSSGAVLPRDLNRPQAVISYESFRRRYRSMPEAEMQLYDRYLSLSTYQRSEEFVLGMPYTFVMPAWYSFFGGSRLYPSVAANAELRGDMLAELKSDVGLRRWLKRNRPDRWAALSLDAEFPAP